MVCHFVNSKLTEELAKVEFFYLPVHDSELFLPSSMANIKQTKNPKSLSYCENFCILK